MCFFFLMFPTEQRCVCVQDRPGLVCVPVFLWKSHTGSTNTVRGSTPARKQQLLMLNTHSENTRSHTFRHQGISVVFVPNPVSSLLISQIEEQWDTTILWRDVIISICVVYCDFCNCCSLMFHFQTSPSSSCLILCCIFYFGF